MVATPRTTPQAASDTSVPALACPCSACLALRAEYTGDPALLTFYGRRLLRRGWAGAVTPTERAYIRAHACWAKQATQAVAGRGTPFQARSEGAETAVQTASPDEA